MDDWPQWRGRDGLGAWSLDLQKASLRPGDLEKVWEAPLGSGYCGPTVSGGRLYVMDYDRPAERERVHCFDAETGEKQWTHAYARQYSVGYPTGPRASVSIDGNRVYSLGTMGDLYCLDAGSGDVIWYIDGKKDHDLAIPTWGIAGAPLVEGNLVIVQWGGQPDACVAAFDKANGQEVWHALSDPASYVAPMMIQQAGRRVLLCWTADHLVGMDPKNGHVHWKIPNQRRKGVINIASPAYQPPYVFLSHFWDGSMLVKLSENELRAELVWRRAGVNERNTDALHCCISTPVIRGEHIYGVDSYGEFRYLELLSGDRVWTDSTLVPFGRWANAHLVTQGEKTWAFNERGELILCQLSPEGFTDLGRTLLLDPVRISPNPRGGVNWAHPAFAGRWIFARSDAKLVAYKLID